MCPIPPPPPQKKKKDVGPFSLGEIKSKSLQLIEFDAFLLLKLVLK